MAGQIYLYLSGIAGEATAERFEGLMDITSFSVGNAMEVDMEARTGSGGGTSGAADPEDLSVDKKMDWASPIMLSCCATGAVIPRGRLFQCNVVDDDVYPVSDYAFSSSIITSVSLSGSGGAIPDESVTINYGSIIWQYHCYNHQVASQCLASQHRGWSLISATPNQPDGPLYDFFSSQTSTTGGIAITSGQFSYEGCGGVGEAVFSGTNPPPGIGS